MFGRVLTKIFKRGTPIAKTAPAKESAGTNPFERTAAKGGKSAEPAQKVADSVKEQWQSKADKSIDAKASPEELCGVNKSMPKDEVAEKLAVLYRRHNRAASSLDAKMREESEIMLEAIATVKEKYFRKR